MQKIIFCRRKKGAIIIMLTSLSANDLVLKREWYEIRDLFLGQNRKKQDVKRALKMAATCRHPDAQWLTGVCGGKNVKTSEHALSVFLAQGNDDARALCFAALVHGAYNDEPRLRRSAEMGFAFAQGCMCIETEGLESFIFASQAAAQGEREGFYFLGFSYRSGDGCDKNWEKAKENFMIAAKLGDFAAMYDVCELLDETDPRFWHWSGVLAARGHPMVFLDIFSRNVNRFESDPSFAIAMFAIGRALKGHIDEQKGEIFGNNSYFNKRTGQANRAIGFFNDQCCAARKAVDAWCLMAI